MVSLLAESWTWYAFALLVACFRFVSRFIQLGSLKRFELEDAIMFLVLCCYTVLIVSINIVSKLSTNLLYPGEIIDPASIESRIHGSKLILVLETSMVFLIWGCKACLLLLYNKLTFGLKAQWSVKIVAIYCGVSLLVMEILYFGVWCRPIKNYWAVPTPNEQCSTALNHLITNAAFNISSDVMMLCIPLPLLLKSTLPRMKKCILCGLFGLGGFVILSAVLNKYYSFSQPFAPDWTFWYIREASTAILVANIPQCWPLIRQMFKLRSWNGSSHSHNRTRTNPLAYGRSTTQKPTNSIPLGSMPRSTHDNGVIHHIKSPKEVKKMTTWYQTERGSEEDILPSNKSGRRGSLEIWKTEVFEVQSEMALSTREGSAMSSESAVSVLEEKGKVQRTK